MGQLIKFCEEVSGKEMSMFVINGCQTFTSIELFTISVFKYDQMR